MISYLYLNHRVVYKSTDRRVAGPLDLQITDAAGQSFPKPLSHQLLSITGKDIVSKINIFSILAFCYSLHKSQLQACDVNTRR